MTIKAVAIDDEPLALEVIRSLAEKVPFIDLQESFTNAFKAIDHLAGHPVDLLFLDIKMPDINGMELLASLRQKPLVVFTTAYAEHAVLSYELDAVDYLLKPFSFARFLKACNKAREVLNADRESKNDNPPASIFIKSGYEQLRVSFDELLYLESGGNYVTLKLTGDRQVLSRLTMAEVQQLLPADKFVRIHRSYIVNKEKVSKAERHRVHIDGRALPVSAGFKFSLTASPK
ncbi:LytTR family DNA-binding domain-containing protein [Mucilaginibacter sp. 14171R-50]|uniref:LytR/AlgR family response regulator transcription factor n=1 Tax=Mucilaginibacter sp. 14171R-50 TaxID=2703789 RepID=UPI001EE4A044|nr:LytTR family DNA-binding domain-containing protein [Mucilaginibacter sp. 14171R-50]